MTGFFAYAGELRSSDHEAVARLLTAWAGAPVRVSLGLHGWEIDLDDDTLALYAEPARSAPSFLLSGTLHGTHRHLLDRLHALGSAAATAGIPCTLEYFTTDEHGHPIENAASGVLPSPPSPPPTHRTVSRPGE